MTTKIFFKIYVSILFLAILVGCSSDVTDEDTLINEENIVVNQKVISGTVKDNNNNPLSNINVKFEYLVNGEEESEVTTTNNQGQYTIKIDKEFLQNDTNYLIYAFKSGYVPSTKTFKIDNYQDNYYINFILNPIQENELILEIEPKIHHLGDDYYHGSINSQFQKKTEGLEFEKEFYINSTQYNSYSKAVLKFEGKGIQVDDDKLIINGKSYNLESSPSDGSYKTYAIELDKSIYNEGLNSLKITSGYDGDYDDFEFSNIILEFQE